MVLWLTCLILWVHLTLSCICWRLLQSEFILLQRQALQHPAELLILPDFPHLAGSQQFRTSGVDSCLMVDLVTVCSWTGVRRSMLQSLGAAVTASCVSISSFSFWMLSSAGISTESKLAWQIWAIVCCGCSSWHSPGLNRHPQDHTTVALTTELPQPPSASTCLRN